MRACPGCTDPKCGEDEKKFAYKGVELLTCKKVDDGKAYCLDRKYIKEREEIKDWAVSLSHLKALIEDEEKYKNE